MKKLIILILITNCSVILAQRNNRIALNIGEVAYSDWRARIWVEAGLSYTHIWAKHISTSLNVNYYAWDITEYWEFQDLNIPDGKNISK